MWAVAPLSHYQKKMTRSFALHVSSGAIRFPSSEIKKKKKKWSQKCLHCVWAAAPSVVVNVTSASFFSFFSFSWCAAAPSVVVNVTSAGMYLAKADVSDLQVFSFFFLFFWCVWPAGFFFCSFYFFFFFWCVWPAGFFFPLLSALLLS